MSLCFCSSVYMCLSLYISHSPPKPFWNIRVCLKASLRDCQSSPPPPLPLPPLPALPLLFFFSSSTSTPSLPQFSLPLSPPPPLHLRPLLFFLSSSFSRLH